MPSSNCSVNHAWSDRRRQSSDLAVRGEVTTARQALYALTQEAESAEERAAAISDLAAISAATGRMAAARRGWKQALRWNPALSAAQRNLTTLATRIPASPSVSDEPMRTKIAILSLLFNWPSTGGGTVHTKELAEALHRDGYDVQHLYAVYAPWRVGIVTEPLSVPTRPLEFAAHEWSAESIQTRFRDAVDDFAPDAVIIADSWNTKPLLAEAVADYPYFLRLAALETLCPLNNVRLLFEQGCLVQCLRNQLAEPAACRHCVQKFARHSGSLHQAERALAGFEGDDFPARLRRAYRGAEAVLAVNPTIADLVRPFCRRVEVVPSGFDPQRFWEPDFHDDASPDTAPTRFVFAGLVDEPMKGFSILFEACRRLWSVRQDFELVVTSDPRSDWHAPFVQWIGWQSQADLPQAIRSADILVFPTIAQEALGRTAVEAMGCGKPVIASNLGGLPWVVEDNVTCLIVTPGDVYDLAEKMQRLIEDAPLRRCLGQAGRQKFAREFPWPVILARHYRPLLQQLVAQSGA